MRIIAGKYKSMQIPLPKGGEIRPTTDRTREALFNILTHRINLEELAVLDLFAGSGAVSIEFASRGCNPVIGVEKNARVVSQIKSFLQTKDIPEVKIRRGDAFRFIRMSQIQFDIIFADPPYHMESIQEMVTQVMEHKVLKANGLLIVEHADTLNLEHERLKESRKYGQSVFSFFSN